MFHKVFINFFHKVVPLISFRKPDTKRCIIYPGTSAGGKMLSVYHDWLDVNLIGPLDRTFFYSAANSLIPINHMTLLFSEELEI